MIRTKKLSTTAVLGTLAISLATIPNAQAGDPTVSWGYKGAGNPSQWGQLSPEFVTCEAGHSQSPIDIHSVKKEPLSEPECHEDKLNPF